MSHSEDLLEEKLWCAKNRICLFIWFNFPTYVHSFIHTMQSGFEEISQHLKIRVRAIQQPNIIPLSLNSDNGKYYKPLF